MLARYREQLENQKLAHLKKANSSTNAALRMRTLSKNEKTIIIIIIRVCK